MKKLALSLTALLLVISTAFAGPIIRHAKISSKPAAADPSQIGGPDWNADHVIDTTALLGAEGITVVSSNPNGVTTGTVGQLAWDQPDAQLFINTDGGTTWTAFVRADGGTTPDQTFFAQIGDSNTVGQGDPSKASPDEFVLIPNPETVFEAYYATASSEPLSFTELPIGNLRAYNATGGVAGFGFELSVGDILFKLRNGQTAVPVAGNVPWLVKMAISGTTLDMWRPASTYGTASPQLGGSNLYTAWKLRTQQFIASSGRKLGGVIINLGTNDAASTITANAFAANMVALIAQIRADFGNQVVIVWIETHASTSPSDHPGLATVRAAEVAAPSSIAGLKIVPIDDTVLLSDLLHYDADSLWTIGGRAAIAMADLKGYARRRIDAAPVVVVGYGTPGFNAATIAPRAWPGTKDGDTLLLFVSSSWIGGSPVTVPTPSGWSLVSASSTSASGVTEEFALFSRTIAQAELDANGGIPSSTAVTPGGNENSAQIYTLRGPNRFPAVDGPAVAFAGGSFTTSAVTAGGLTTTQSNELVLVFSGAEAGGLGGSQSISYANSNIPGGKINDAPHLMSDSNFHTLSLFAGTAASPGAIGNTIITPAVSTNLHGFTAAIRD